MNHVLGVVILSVLSTLPALGDVADVRVVSGNGAAVDYRGPGSGLAFVDLADEGDTVLQLDLTNSVGFEALLLTIQDPLAFDMLELNIGTIVGNEFTTGGAFSLLDANYNGVSGTPTPSGFLFGSLSANGTIGFFATGPPGQESFALRLSPTFVTIPEPAAGLVLLTPLLGRRSSRA